jgi:hypothetical protein
MATFPSIGWFEALQQAMLSHRERNRKLGTIDVTLVPAITFPDGHVERYALIFEAHDRISVKRVRSTEEIVGPQVSIAGDYAVWREMVENIRDHGAADLQHTLNYLTLPDWPLRLSGASGQDPLAVDRFYRCQERLQEFFNEAAAVATEFAA